MIPQKVKEYLDEYIIQEVYVQISIIKGKEKVSTINAVKKYYNSNHFKHLAEGRPYNNFIDGIRDKCLGKLKNSPMRNTKSNDEVIIQLQKKLPIPIIYSATRGVHKRMLHDLKRYKKYFAISNNAPRKAWAISQYKKKIGQLKELLEE